MVSDFRAYKFCTRTLTDRCVCGAFANVCRDECRASARLVEDLHAAHFDWHPREQPHCKWRQLCSAEGHDVSRCRLNHLPDLGQPARMSAHLWQLSRTGVNRLQIRTATRATSPVSEGPGPGQGPHDVQMGICGCATGAWYEQGRCACLATHHSGPPAAGC
jgi:hypothetical protein